MEPSKRLHQMDKAQPGARLLEELDIINYRSSNSCSELRSHRRSSPSLFFNWKEKVLRFLDEIRRRRSVQCVVCLQIHQIDGLPAAMSGRALVVGWKTKGCKGEHTLPVQVRKGGAAAFEEIFLHYCCTDVISVLKSFTIWVSLVDAADCDLGNFPLDLSELGEVKDLNPMFGGKDVSFLLGGAGSGGSLRLSFYCRITDEEPSDQKEGTRWCFSCLPDLESLRSRPLPFSARKIPSLKSDSGFITIENSISKCLPASGSGNGDDGEGGDRVPEPEKDEFLRMIEEKKHWKCRDMDGGVEDDQPWQKGIDRKLSFVSMDLDMDADLENLIKEAEQELAKAAEVWKNRVDTRV